MLRLVGAVLVAAALWSGWWLVGARGTAAGWQAWLDQRRGAGWLAEAGAVRVAGFPARFALDLTGLDLADPATGLAWSAPAFRLASPAWDPTDVTATFAPRQEISTPAERIGIETGAMTARLALVPGPALTLRRAEAALEDVALTSTRGWRTRLDRARLVLARAEGEGHPYDLSVEAAGYEPAVPLLARLDPGGRLPRVVDMLSVDARLGFDRPWDRRAVEAGRPQPRALDLRRLTARWGALELEAAGAVTIDAAGFPAGEIQIRAVNWREMIALGVAAGLVPEEIAGGLETALGLLAAAAGNPATLEAPLGFRDGLVKLGPVPIGPAPRLILR